MKSRLAGSLVFLLLLLASPAWADPPVASYIFPAGGQRGSKVSFKVGGLNLFQSCGFEMLGTGIEAPKQLQRTKTVWFEGPLLPLPDSQQAEDYPKDMAGQLTIAADAAPGLRHWRLWTAQGATPALKFMVGDLPEMIEQEIAGDPVPVPAKLPVTINGRIFPRENVDIWSFQATKGQTIAAEVYAARLGSPLDSHLELIDPSGRRIAENDDTYGSDSFLCFTAPEAGTYQIRIRDIHFKGGPAYVYRLTLQARPHVSHFYPLGGQAGTKVKLELTGHGLAERHAEVNIPGDAPRAYPVNLGNPLLLDVDSLPEHLEAQPTAEQAQARPVAMPAMLNGRILQPGEAGFWAFAGKKGEAVELDLRAARLGSSLSAVLTVLDGTGKELARAENIGGQADPQLRFTPATDGTYVLKVEERFRGRAGPGYAYRLRVAPPAAADFRLTLASDAVTVNRGGTAKLKIAADRFGGFAEAINLEIDGLPTGVTATGTSIAAKQAGGEITFKAESAAAITASRLAIRGVAMVGDRPLTRTATLPAPRGAPELDSLLLAVAVPTPFKIVADFDMRWAARGTYHQRRYRIERNGFEGPIEVSLADKQARHLQGVTGGTITVPPGANEFSYGVQLPPWMETGRTCRVCVMGVGVVKDADGAQHTVSFSSVNPNEQIVAVIGPGRLSVAATPASLAVNPGQTAKVTVQVSRVRGLEGPVKLELAIPEHLRGIVADPVTLAADQSSASLTIRFSADARGPFNLPLVIRATLVENGQPVMAETPLSLHLER